MHVSLNNRQIPLQLNTDPIKLSTDLTVGPSQVERSAL